MNEKLRKLQLCELEILKEFVRICNRFSLRYYLTGGTLLGAVRHQGFIPWDDDIDVAMPREDYDRFAQIAPQELDPQYFYQSPDTDPYYFLSYNKIRKNGTEIYEERFENGKFHKGIFIDLFPLDFCPAPGLVCHFLFNVLAVMSYRGQVDSGERYVPYEELSGKIGYTVLRLLSKRQILKFRKHLLGLSHWLSSGSHVVLYSGAYGYYREVMPKEWYFEENTLKFEGQNFFVPADAQSLLTQVYGNEYMTAPEKSGQKCHIELDKSCF